MRSNAQQAGEEKTFWKWGLLECIYCNRTATGLVQASTQWTSRFARKAKNPLNKRNFRTHEGGLACTQANS
jgi:hypothetical protein